MSTFAEPWLKLQSRQSLDNAEKLAQTEDGIPINASVFDANPHILNVANGIVNLISGEILPHDPEALCTKITRTACDFDLPTPVWMNFLDSTFESDVELMGFLQRWAGYCATGCTDERKMVIATGSGANGKSTALNTIAQVLGDYATNMAVTSLMEQGPNVIREDLAALQGARLALANEGNKRQVLDTGIVKSLTGRDPIRARFLRENGFVFVPQVKITFVTNNLPEIDGSDQAIWDRLLFLNFNRRFEEHERDPHLPEKLAAELPGILAWIVRGAVDWYRQGLNPPASMLQVRDQCRRDMDVVGGFIHDCCTLARDAEVKASDLYSAFCHYAETLGHSVMSQARFGNELERFGIGKRKSALIIRTGVALKPRHFEGLLP